MSASKLVYLPLAVTLATVRLGLLLGLIFLRLVLTFLQGNQAPITCQITRFYLISCGIFVVQTGDKSKDETQCPVNRQSGIDELVLALTTPIKSLISRDQWKLSSILLRITNMSTGGVSATTQRYVFEGTAEFKNLPAQQSVQPISLEVSSFSPFQLSPDEGAMRSLLKIIATPITLYQLRMLKPMRADEDVSEKVSTSIAKSLTSPQSSQVYRAPLQHQQQQQHQSARQAPVRLPVSAAILEQADTVMEVFPQLSRDHVIADLRRTGNLNETIRNAMAERIPQAPPKGSVKAEAAGKLEIDPKVKEEVESSIVDGTNPVKAWMNLEQRKSALLHFGRTMYLSKHSS